MADQQNSYIVPPALPLQRRRILGYLPWSWTGIVLALLYFLFMMYGLIETHNCFATSSPDNYCAVPIVVLTAPSVLLFTGVDNIVSSPQLLEWIFIPILLNTLLVYLLGAGVGKIATMMHRAIRR